MNLRNAIQHALSKFEQKETLYAAFLGKADKTLRVTGKSGWMYCRMWNGEVVEAYNLGGVPASPGLAVNLAFRQGRFYILSKDVYKDLVRTGIPDGIEDELQFPGTHTLYVRGEQFLPGLVYPKSALILSILGGVIPLDAGGYIQVQPAEVDMNAYLPVSGALWATIELTQAGSVTVTTGGAKPAMNELDLADVPTTDGAYPLAAVRLRFGQSNIAWGKYKNDVVDLRWGRKSGGGSLPTYDPLRVVYTDSSGASKTSDELIFNEDDDTFAIGDPAGTGGGGGSSLHGLGGDKTHSGGSSTFHRLVTYAGDNARASLVRLISSLGTKASPLAVLANTLLGRIRFGGYDGDTLVYLSATSADIKAVASEDFDASSHGTDVVIATTPKGSITMQDVFKVDSEGQLSLLEYGAGTFTGTVAKTLGVTSGGAVIETDGGGGGDWEMIADITLGSNTASFDFTSIPSTYKHLKIIYSLRSNRSARSDRIKVVVNNDTASSKYLAIMYYWYQPSTWGTIDPGVTTSAIMTFVCAGTALANSFGGGFIEFPDYANTTKLKLFQSRGGQVQSTTIKPEIYDGMAVWQDTSAISRITISPVYGTNFKTNSRCTLYGMK